MASPEIEDLTGNTFGRWTVISRAENTPKRGSYWLCRCECGTEKPVSGHNLRRGKSRSCGCLASESARRKHAIDETGNRYGKLVVAGRSNKQYNTKNTSIFWECVCDCGQTTVVNGTVLRQGKTHSCGCLRGEHNRLPRGEAAFNGLFGQYKRKAKSRGLDWNLSKEQFRTLTQGECVYCGAQPTTMHGAGQGINGGYLYNGVDRVDSREGYLPSNVVSCCGVCNIAKRTATKDEFLAWVKRIHDRHFK